jgi:hypothetical protein
VTIGRKIRLIYHALASYDSLFCMGIATLATVGVLGFRWLVLDHDIQWWEWLFTFACGLIGSVGTMLFAYALTRRRSK